MRIPTLTLMAASALLLAGCATQSALKLPAAPVPAAYPNGPAYTADSSARSAADTGWRDFLRDARLQRLVELALANNRDLRVAALNVEKVRAQYGLARSALSPQLNLGAGAQRQGGTTLSGTHNALPQNVSANLAASWELDFFGRLHSMSEAALQRYLASEDARQAAQLLLISQVADQYLVLRAADEQLAVTRATLDSAAASRTLIGLQLKAGTASDLEDQQSQATLELAQANLAAQQRARAQAENGLALLLGEPIPAGLPPAMAFDAPGLLADVPAGLPSELLARRPDIAQAEATLRAAHADVGAARAAFFPRISLTGTLGSAAPALSSLFGAGTGVWSFAPSLLMPVFDGGANQANLDAATAQRSIDVAQYEKSIQSAFREVADGLAARGTYDAQLAAQQRYAAVQQRRLALANQLYAAGVDSYLEVLTAQTDAYNAESSVVTVRLGRLTSLVDLYRALGGGWQERSPAPPMASAAIGYANGRWTSGSQP
jgi:multidrug efflux system outer membrane protein